MYVVSKEKKTKFSDIVVEVVENLDEIAKSEKLEYEFFFLSSSMDFYGIFINDKCAIINARCKI